MDFQHEFGLYDIVGHFVPGAVLLLVAIWRFRPDLIKEQLGPAEQAGPSAKNGKVSRVIVFVIVAYIAGGLVQALASPVDKFFFADKWPGRTPTKHFRSGFQNSVYKAFGRDDYDSREVYELCREYLRVHEIGSFAETMDARFAFFRGLYVSLALSFVLLLSQGRSARISILVVLLLACVLACYRSRKFEGYRNSSVFRTFYVHSVTGQRKTP